MYSVIYVFSCICIRDFQHYSSTPRISSLFHSWIISLILAQLDVLLLNIRNMKGTCSPRQDAFPWELTQNVYMEHQPWWLKFLSKWQYNTSVSGERRKRKVEPLHDKTNKVTVRPAKTLISPVWSESSLSAWRKLGSLATYWVHSEDSDQTGRMPRLIWVFAGRTVTLLVLSCHGSVLSFPGLAERKEVYVSHYGEGGEKGGWD